MLATYRAIMALYVGDLQSHHGTVCGNLQLSLLCTSATYSPRSRVCWQSTALVALYIGNLEPSWPVFWHSAHALETHQNLESHSESESEP